MFFVFPLGHFDHFSILCIFQFFYTLTNVSSACFVNYWEMLKLPNMIRFFYFSFSSVNFATYFSSFTEIWVIYNKLYQFKVYNLILFDMCIRLQNHHQNQDHEHIAHPPYLLLFLCDLYLSPLLISPVQFCKQPPTCFLSL